MASFDVVSRLIHDDIALLAQCSRELHASNVEVAAQCLRTLHDHIGSAFAAPDAGNEEASALPASEKQLILHAMLSAEPSLWTFVAVAVSSETMLAGAVPSAALEGIFSACCLVLERAPGLLQHAQLVKMRRTAFDVFLIFARLGKHMVVQGEALRLLCTLLRQLPHGLTAGDFDAKGMRPHLCRAASRKTGQTARSCALQLLGKLCRVFPTEMALESGAIKAVFMDVLNQMASRAEPENTLGEGLLLGFDDYLAEFSVGAAEEAAAGEQGAYLTKLYAFVRCALLLADATGRYAFIKAGLKLLKHRALLFKELLTASASEWLALMEALCGHKNEALHKTAYPASMAVIQAIAFELCEEHGHRTPAQSAALLGQLLQQAKGLLAHNTRPYTLSYAIVVYGMLARPMARFGGAKLLIALFEELAARCEGLFAAAPQDAMEHAARHLPAFLSTFACLLLETVAPSAAIMDTVDSLLHTMLLMYPKQYYFRKIRAATPTAVLKLFVAARHRRGVPVAGDLLTVFVRRALAFSMGSSAMFGGGGASGPAMAETATAFTEGALYEEYAALWTGLCGSAPINIDDWGYPWTHVPQCAGAIVEVQESLRHACLTQTAELFGRLDVSLAVLPAQQTHHHHHHHGSNSGTPTATTAASAHLLRIAVQDGCMAPTAPKDYSLFLNLTPLFVALVPLVLPPDSPVCLAWVLHFATKLMERSAANAHVSGFYTCMASVLQQLQLHAPDGIKVEEDEPAVFSSNRGAAGGGGSQGGEGLCAQLSATLRHFHRHTAALLAEYTDELLFSAARCLVQIPPHIVPVAQQAPVLQQLMELGKDCAPAATAAIDAVERWLATVPADAVLPILPAVLAAMPQEMNANSSAMEVGLPARITRLVGTHGLLLASVAGAMADDAASNSSSSDAAGHEGPSAATAAQLRVDPTRPLKVTLPLREVSVDFPFGRVLTRVIHLSRQSPDRKIRVASGELLHALVMWLLGSPRIAVDYSLEMRVVFPAIVDLAASTDAVLAQLFQPLAEGLARWYAQNTSTHYKEVQAFLDALCDCLASPQRAALRNVSSATLVEFLRWSRRNSVDRGHANATLLMRRLAAMLHHPSPWRRLGAAVAFSKLYVHFREMQQAVVDHTFDLVYYALLALKASEMDRVDTGATLHLRTMLAHLEKIVVGHAAVLVGPQASAAGGGRFASLRDVVNWMFQQCCCPEPLARGIAMQLFTTFCVCLPGFDSDDGPMRWLASIWRDVPAESIFKDVLDGFAFRDPDACIGRCMSHVKYVEWCRELCASVDCHLWLLRDRLLPAHIPFGRRTHPEELKRRRMEATLARSPPRGPAGPTDHHPKSRLVAHLAAFVRQIRSSDSFVTRAAEDSQALWIEPTTTSAAGIVSNDQRELATCKLDVLERYGDLLGVLGERFPTSLWVETDPACCDGAVPPLVSTALLEVATTLLCCPRTFLGAEATIADVAARAVRCGFGLLRKLWAFAQPGGVLHHEATFLLTAIAAGLPRDAAEPHALLSLVVATPADAQPLLRGLRALHACDLLQPLLSRSMSLAHLAASMLDALTLRFVKLPAVQAISPIFCATLREYTALMFALPLDPVAILPLSSPPTNGTPMLLAPTRSLSTVDGGGVAGPELATLQALAALLRPDIDAFLVANCGALVASWTAAAGAGAVDLSAGAGAVDLSARHGHLLLMLCQHPAVKPPCAAAIGAAWPALLGEGGEGGAEAITRRVRCATALTRSPSAAAVAAFLAHTWQRVLADVALCLAPATHLIPSHTLLQSREGTSLLLLGLDLAAGLVTHSAAHGGALDPLLTPLVASLIVDEFPLSVIELSVGSTELENYMALVTGLFQLMERVGAAVPLLVLELLPLLHDPTHPCTDVMSTAIANLLATLTPPTLALLTAKALERLGMPLPVAVRRALTQRIILPTLRHLPRAHCERLFCGQVQSLYAQAEKVGFTGTADAAATQAVTRITAFVLLQSMCRYCSPDALKGSICQAFTGQPASATTGKELTEKLMRACIAARSSSSSAAGGGGEALLDPKLRLQYHQAAHACLIAVLVATQRQEKLFVQFLLKDRAVWSVVCDLSRQHLFTVETNFSSLRDLIVQARTDWELTHAIPATAAARADGLPSTATSAVVGARRMKYLSSQYLLDSHVHPDANPSLHAAVVSPHSSSDSSSDPTPHAANGAAVAAAVVPAVKQTPRERKNWVAASFHAEGDGGLLPGDIQPAQQPASCPADDVDVFTVDRAGGGSSSELIELDGVWASSCTGALLHLVDFMIRHFSSSSADPTQLSAAAAAHFYGSGGGGWASELVAALADTHLHINARLVLMRLVLLRADFFAKFAYQLVEPLIDIATAPEIGVGVHYIVRDVALCLLRWPLSAASDAAASRLVSYFVRNITHATTTVIRENLELLKLLMEKLEGRVHIAKRELMGWLTYDDSKAGAKIARLCGLQVCGVVAAQGLPIYAHRHDAASLTEDVFHQHLAQNLLFPTAREVSCSAAEVLGMALRNLKRAHHDDSCAQLLDVVHQRLARVPADKFLTLLRKVAEYFPYVVDSYLPQRLFNNHSFLSAADKVTVLELLSMRAELANRFFPALHAQVAGTRDLPDLQLVAFFNLLLELVPKLSPDFVCHVHTTFVKPGWLRMLGATPDGRVAFYRLCIHLYDNHEAALGKAANEALLVLIVAGFEDSSLFVRDLVVRFCDQAARLPDDGLPRFHRLLGKGHVDGAGKSWLQLSAVLMLALCHRSPDFKKTDLLCHAPLAQCTFRQVSPGSATVASAAAAPSLGTMAPMFASQLPVSRMQHLPASLGGFRRAEAGDGDGGGGGESLLPGHAIRTVRMLASQPVSNRLFQPTQHGKFASFEASVLPSLATSSLMFTTSALTGAAGGAAVAGGMAAPHQQAVGSEGGGGQPCVVRRRFTASTDDAAVGRHILHASRLRTERAAREAAMKAQQAASHVLFRAYREGEVPDVQISLEAIVVPLQALCLFDAETAALVMTLLGEGIVLKMAELSASQPPGGAPPSMAPNHPTMSVVSSLLGDMATSAVSVHAARTMRDDVWTSFSTTLLRNAVSPSLIRFAHEMLLVMAKGYAPSALPPFEAIFASSVAPGCAASALLLMERCTERWVEFEASLAPSPAAAAAAASTIRTGWIHYFMALRRNNEDLVARAASKRIDVLRESFETFSDTCETGDFDAAIKGISTVQAGLATSGRAGDGLIQQLLQHETSRALAALLQWQPLATTLLAVPEDHLWCMGREPDVELLVSALAKTQHPTLMALLGRHQLRLSGGYALPRVWTLLAQGDYVQARRQAQLAVMEELSVEGGGGGSTLQPSTLHRIFLAGAMWDATAALIAAPSGDPHTVAATLSQVVGRFGLAVPLGAHPQQWDDLLFTLDLLTSAGTQALARSADDKRAFARNAQQVATGVFTRAASTLADVPSGNAAARALLSRAFAKRKEEGEFDAGLWTAAVHTTIYRFYFTSTPAKFRDQFGEVQKSIRSHADRIAPRQFADVEGAFWPLFARTLLKHEGLTAANSAEVVGLATRAIVKLSPLQDHQASAESLFELCQVVLTASRDDDRLLDERTTDALGGHLAKALLHAMEAFHSVRARAAVPALLGIVQDPRHATARSELVARSAAVPTWMLVPWLPQLLSMLLHCTAHRPCVATLLGRMALHHPQAVFYTYNCALEDINALAVSIAAAPSSFPKEVVDCLSLLSSVMESSGLSMLHAFARHLYQLDSPTLRLRRWIEEIQAARKAAAAASGGGGGTAVMDAPQRLLAQMIAECVVVHGGGKLNKDCAARYAHPAAEALKAGDVTHSIFAAIKDLRESTSEQTLLLADFSDTLATLSPSPDSENFLDVPQQGFTWLKGHAPGANARVVGLDSHITVMASIQKPKRLKLFGSDGQTHTFLVKGGDDLRLDERVEQLFTAVNGLAPPTATAATCAASIRTYSVIPVTKRIGLVQWVGETDQLKQVVVRQMQHRENRHGFGLDDHLSKQEYVAFMNGLQPGPSTTLPFKILNSFKLVGNAHGEHTTRVTEWIGKIYRYYLRDGLEAIADDRSGYYRLRAKFCASLAGLSVASYILGIGDRHLENFLIDKKTGEVVSIDFGHAFGSATTQLIVPELVPFRLSPQMVHVLGPLGTDRLVPSMTRTTAAVRDKRALLLSIASLFLSEPLHVWQKEAGGKRSVQDVARDKLQTVRRKLDGDNPVAILEAEIRRNAIVERHKVTEDVVRAARGEPRKRELTQGPMREGPFVTMLIDIATDPNVAGHSWIGWNALF